jgi:hypothetical protein
LGGIHPTDNIQTNRHPGGNASWHWLGRGRGYSNRPSVVSLLSARVVTASVYGNCRVTNHDDGVDGMQHVRTAYRSY